MTKFPLGALTHDVASMDLRDFKVEDVLPTPTPAQLTNLPSVMNWLGNIGSTLNQGNIGSCTALGTTHAMQIMNVTEWEADDKPDTSAMVNKLKNGDNILTSNDTWKDLWIKMGHDLINEGGGDYVEHAIDTLHQKGELGKNIFGEKYLYKCDGYAYYTIDTTPTGIQQLKFQLSQSPLVFIMNGGDTLWNSMEEGEVVMQVNTGWNGGHCICLCGRDQTGFLFLNSWTPNSGSLCMFHMSYDIFNQMVAQHSINWRCWRLFDTQDSIVDLNKHLAKVQAMQCLRDLKKLYSIATPAVQHKMDSWQVGKYFEGVYGFTDTDL